MKNKKLNSEIEKAILEEDVMSLRENLKQITNKKEKSNGIKNFFKRLFGRNF